MTAPDLAAALLRTTLATSAAACLTALLLARLRVHAPRTHRLAWALVVLQGWALLPWTITLRQPAPPAETTGATTMSAPAGADFIPIPADAPILITTPPAAPDPWRPADFASPAIFAWLAGALTLALFAAARYARLAAALPRGAAPDNAAWNTEWQRELARARGGRGGASASRLPFPKRIDFRITQSLGPLVAFIPPAYRVLAPHSLWTALTRPQRRAILRHELAHIRRRDLWKSLALRALALPQWFNPLVWLAVRRFDEAAEWSCDADAARGLARQPTTIAAALIRTAELTTATRPITTLGFIPAIPTGHRTPLARRIHRLVTPRFKEESIMRKLLVPALLATLAAAQLIRLERVAAQDPPPSQDGPADSTRLMTLSEWLAMPRRDITAPDGDEEERLGIAVAPPAAAAPAPSTPAEPPTPPSSAPRELAMRTLPRYVIEPPDILLIEGVKLVPKLPYRIQCFDVLQVRFPGEQEHQFTDVDFLVVPGGTVHLGVNEGNVAVAGLTLEEAQDEVRQRLRNRKAKEVTVSLREIGNAQKISGQHLVAMDGRVNLGVYGSVFVAGLTIAETRAAIEKHLAEDFDDPQVSVDVLAYNSKVYYIITKGLGAGDDVVRAPVTGNETVLDAVANLGGVSQAAATKMWIARPAPQGRGSEQILPVAWNDIARGASTETNYQLLPGDRLFIETTTPPVAVAAQPASPSEITSADAQISEAPSRAAPPRPVTTAADPGPDAAVTLELHLPQDRTHKQTLSLTGPTKVGDLLTLAVYPEPIDFAAATISLSRPFGPRELGGIAEFFIGWDRAAQRPKADSDYGVEAGDWITIDLRKPEPGATILPNPVLPAPQSAPPAEAASPTKEQIEFSVTFIEDIDGDFAELAGAEGDLEVAIRDAATLEPALRVLERHNHIKRLVDPKIVAKPGEPAHFNAAVPIPGGDGLFHAQYQVRVLAHRSAGEEGSSAHKMELAAMAHHDKKIFSIDCGFMLRRGQTGIARLRSETGEAGPIYVVVTPSLHD